jgi:pimeloyl-ACP methyl ester carboxylesterase
MDSPYKIAPAEPQFLPVGKGAEAREIPFIAQRSGNSGRPGLFWLSGFMSEMGSTKATAVAQWAAERDLSSTRFDYSGHGISKELIEGGTIGRWLEEAEAIFFEVSEGPQIVIGSSMGGHIALLLLRKLLRERPEEAARIKALVLIAPAWDMTEELMWKRFPDEVRREILERGFFKQPSAYAEPYTITRRLIEDGREHLLGREPFDPGRPVVIVQGLLDVDVPASHARELTTFLTGDKVKLIEVADAEHRLSRPQDLDLLFSEISKLI